jgi:glycosyltransferase involved in cell wall biosynthesis
MRVLLTAGHVYPMSALRSAGRAVTAFPSGSAQRLQDWTAKALAEIGHDVVYVVSGQRSAPPPGVELVEGIDRVDFSRIDVAHTFAPKFESVFAGAGVPFISVLHIHPAVRPDFAPSVREGTNDTVYVSRWLAQAFGSTRVVYNGVDPSEYLYSASKGDYFLFMTSMDWAHGKGLDVAIDVAARAGRKLIVAGSARDPEALERAISMCNVPGVDFVGDVQGPQKRWLLAGAKALIHPSRYPEACPLTIVEAFVSGTPVIATPSGGTPELVTPDVGFLGETVEELADAAARIHEIDPRACRAKALREFHYQRMTRDYLREYEAAIFTSGTAQTSDEGAASPQKERYR